MSKKRIIDTRFWYDTYIADLDPSEKLLFIYLLTNQYTDLCGIYELPYKHIGLDTGFTSEVIKLMMARFEKDGKVFYKDGWVFVKNFEKHQTFNENMKRGAQKSLESIPDEILSYFTQKTEGFSTVLNSSLSNLIKSNLTKSTPLPPKKRKMGGSVSKASTPKEGSSSKDQKPVSSEKPQNRFQQVALFKQFPGDWTEETFKQIWDLALGQAELTGNLFDLAVFYTMHWFRFQRSPTDFQLKVFREREFNREFPLQLEVAKTDPTNEYTQFAYREHAVDNPHEPIENPVAFIRWYMRQPENKPVDRV